MKKHHYLLVIVFVAAAAAFAAAAWQSHRYNQAVLSILDDISTPHAGALSERLVTASTQPFFLITDSETIFVPASLIASWLEPYYRTFTKRKEYRLNQDSIITYLTELAPGLTTEPINARFSIQDGALIETTPSSPGQTLNIQKSLDAIMRGLSHSDAGANLVFDMQEAALTAGKLDAMGITSLLSEGTSTFSGSTQARIHNLKIGIAKMSGTIVQSGEEFSFNSHLGDVDAAAGYLPELVIKGSKIVPEYGGGLCQVSTTLFRAAVLAGFPITERRPHALPVHYYNPQGFDSTIYPGVTDLKFINDTAFPVLIQGRVAGLMAYFEIFGASDGRTVSIDGPHQYDIQPDGALKAVLTRAIMYADGTKKVDNFYSNYKAPSLFETIRNPLE